MLEKQNSETNEPLKQQTCKITFTARHGNDEVQEDIKELNIGGIIYLPDENGKFTVEVPEVEVPLKRTCQFTMKRDEHVKQFTEREKQQAITEHEYINKILQVCMISDEMCEFILQVPIVKLGPIKDPRIYESLTQNFLSKEEWEADSRPSVLRTREPLPGDKKRDMDRDISFCDGVRKLNKIIKQIMPIIDDDDALEAKCQESKINMDYYKYIDENDDCLNQAIFGY